MYDSETPNEPWLDDPFPDYKTQPVMYANGWTFASEAVCLLSARWCPLRSVRAPRTDRRDFDVALALPPPL